MKPRPSILRNIQFGKCANIDQSNHNEGRTGKQLNWPVTDLQRWQPDNDVRTHNPEGMRLLLDTAAGKALDEAALKQHEQWLAIIIFFVSELLSLR